ncbi:MAG: rhodanese-like domain-containing protein [Methanomassiliicoccales archaeon]
MQEDAPVSAAAPRYLTATDLLSLSSEVEQGRFNFIDVRKPEEFAAGHIQGATNIPVDDLEKRIETLDRKKKTILYCKAGKRCLRAADILNKEKFEDVLVLQGGYDAFKATR